MNEWGTEFCRCYQWTWNVTNQNTSQPSSFIPTWNLTSVWNSHIQRKVPRPCVVWPDPVEREEHQAPTLQESHDSEDQRPQTSQFAARRWGKWVSLLFWYPSPRRGLSLTSVLTPHVFPQIKRVNNEAYKKTFEEIVRNIDKMENECIPSVTLSKREVTFLSDFTLWSIDFSVDTERDFMMIPVNRPLFFFKKANAQEFLFFSSSSTLKMWSSCSIRRRLSPSRTTDRCPVSLSLSPNPTNPRTASPGSRPILQKASSLRVRISSRQLGALLV